MRGLELGRSDDGKTEQPFLTATSFSGPAAIAQVTAGDRRGKKEWRPGASILKHRSLQGSCMASVLNPLAGGQPATTPIATAPRTSYHLKSPTSKSSLLTNAESCVS